MIIRTFAVLVVALCCYPPWTIAIFGQPIVCTYALLLSPPPVAQLDAIRLGVEIIALTVLAGALWLTSAPATATGSIASEHGNKQLLLREEVLVPLVVAMIATAFLTYTAYQNHLTEDAASRKAALEAAQKAERDERDRKEQLTRASFLAKVEQQTKLDQTVIEDVHRQLQRPRNFGTKSLLGLRVSLETKLGSSDTAEYTLTVSGSPSRLETFAIDTRTLNLKLYSASKVELASASIQTANLIPLKNTRGALWKLSVHGLIDINETDYGQVRGWSVTQ